MLLRHLPRLYRSFSTTETHLPSSSTSLIPSNLTATTHRDAHTSPNISEPTPPFSEDPSSSRTISLAHPRDSRSENDSESAAPSGLGTEELSRDANSGPHASSQLVAAKSATSHNGVPSYAHPPFHTHQFFTALEKTFPTPTARSLMRATRALLVDRIGRVRREGLTVKDLDNVCILTS